MWRRIKWPFLLVISVALLVAFRKPAEKYFDIAKSLDIFATLFKEVNAYYVDEVEPQKLIRKGIDGMLMSLDPYTDYIAEDELESFRISTTGQYGGIGALIGVIDKKTIVTHPYKNFPANKAGIKVGDELISIDGKSLQGKMTSDVSALLKGQPHTDVELKVKRYGQKDPITLKITREKITLANIAYFGMVEPTVGYIKLDDFTTGAGREVSDALVALKRQGATKIILDLRDNPGGLLHEAVNIVSLFVPKGQEVVSTKGKVEEWNKQYKTLNNAVDTEIPLAVLVNDGSASASEIVAGALQDYDRAVLIGRKTFGKGLVQTTRPLAYNSQLKVTTAKYYIPSGRCIQALDYTHRKEDGTVVKMADSLKSEFKTLHGRKVYDGGGLDPDIVMQDEFLSVVAASMASDGLIFEYATRYCAENPAPASLQSFHLSDKDYEKFLEFLKTEKFTYATVLEKNTNQLIEVAKEERYYTEMESQLSGLKNKVEALKATDLMRFKGEIVEMLEEQIGFHYSLNEGQAAVSIHRDQTILEARKLLNDGGTYHKTLTSTDVLAPKP
ncbi:C-terminal processing peptidase-3. Serine peptidase. MEROPS family S41A [Chryseolinea serpens]|uniref:C-terminal processing peptidase-3. Serine peptidase. MEROPS family S41A n=1 Tax=Chryseolinea serpens TaxID=947013 RepID=A0A1M5XA27_9BACT|nr:S41 family peptidase [Chryseolinea serpens]SHH96418.1 C-terminal processing peptidase-3. Serine peptidase. MEROPS family S41A [Chryseolinea serpens]